ncbi:MAG: ribonuclease HII [Gammaproteobacteria bacterium]
MQSRKIIAGVDEVGRGSLVGSVVSAAVILSDNTSTEDFKDSKKLREKKRIAIANNIIQTSLSVSVGIATKEEIDLMNIHNASLLSMKRAINNLYLKPNLVLVDGIHSPDIDIECRSIIKGDDKIKEISAASIIAKVTRDFEMNYIDTIYPMYSLKDNKGYLTRQHKQAIASFGKTIYHRDSFFTQYE